jgi:hypothetical protein
MQSVIAMYCVDHHSLAVDNDKQCETAWRIEETAHPGDDKPICELHPVTIKDRSL